MHIPTPNSPPTPEDPATLAQVLTLFTEAHRLFHAKKLRQCAHTLALAEATARQHNLHHHAAQYRQALTLLAQGTTPKLLARPLPLNKSKNP